MDELPALQKIPSLPMVLAQGRKYGACVVAGIQNIAQLDRIYDKSGAQELLDLFRTKFFFAVSDNNIAEYASKSLGEVELNETKESLSYGSNTMRDGVNINSIEKVKRLVMPDEIKNLPARTCFVKLCGNYPVTKLQVKLQAPSGLMKWFYKVLASDKELTPSTSNQLAKSIEDSTESFHDQTEHTKQNAISKTDYLEAMCKKPLVKTQCSDITDNKNKNDVSEARKILNELKNTN